MITHFTEDNDTLHASQLQNYFKLIKVYIDIEGKKQDFLNSKEVTLPTAYPLPIKSMIHNEAFLIRANAFDILLKRVLITK